MEVADRVAILHRGRIAQIGTPADVYERPADAFVFNFLGSVNLFRGRTDEGDRIKIGDSAFPAEGARNPGQDAVAFVRSHEIDLSRERNGRPALELEVRQVSRVGPMVRLHAERKDGGDAIEVELSREQYRDLRPAPGERVYATPQHIRVFDDPDYTV